jgi:hypothetical protein
VRTAPFLEGFTRRLRLRHPSLTARKHNPGVRGKLLAAALGAIGAAIVLIPTSLGENVARNLLGDGLVRAEIVARRDGVIQVFRVDRGRVRVFNRSALTLRELDGSIVVVPITPATRFEIAGRPVPFGFVRRGMWATATRVGDEPAEHVLLVRR